jgi:S1-C subfamily serine protease
MKRLTNPKLNLINITVRKFISIVIFLAFSSVAFADHSTKTSLETPLEWKWAKVFNSVVLISSENTSDKVIDEPVPKEFFEEFDDRQRGPNFEEFVPKLPEYGMGTGFFINKIHVVTNYHVIRNFDSIKIYAYDYPFPITDIKIIGYDAEVDIAVIEVIEDIEHDSLEWADNEPLIGDQVYALGHGVSQIWSLTEGILSYDYRPNPSTSFVHYIQTDAVINSGNSGGPLLNEEGEVIGVTTLLISPDKSYVGYGYVIPTPLVKRVVGQILATGKHIKPSIGIMMGIIDDRELYKKLQTAGVDHLLEIKEVIVDSPAYRFGLLAGDIIVSIDGKDIQVVPQVIELLWQRNPGDQLEFKVYRNNEYKIIDLVLGTIKPITSGTDIYSK